MNRIDEHEVNYISKLIKDNTTTNLLMKDEKLEAICISTKLDKDNLLKASLQLLETLAEHYARQSVKISKTESELKVAKDELNILRSKKSVSLNELRLCRMKKGGNTSYRYDASKEMVNYYDQKGMSKEEIAKELGISESTVWRRKKEYEKALEKRLGI